MTCVSRKAVTILLVLSSVVYCRLPREARVRSYVHLINNYMKRYLRLEMTMLNLPQNCPSSDHEATANSLHMQELFRDRNDIFYSVKQFDVR
jgi:hypothetical protein